MLFENIMHIFSMQIVKDALVVTIQYCTIVAIINLFVAHFVCKALVEYHGKWADLFDLCIILPLLIPVILVFSGIHFFMIKAGIIDNMPALVLVNLFPTIPYSIKILRNAFADLGNKYFEQSTLLGATPAKNFFWVNLPLLKESYQYVFILSFTVALSQYALTAIVGGGNIVSLSMVYFPFFNSADKDYLIAFSIIFIALPFTVMIVFKFIYYLLEIGSDYVFTNKKLVKKH